MRTFVVGVERGWWVGLFTGLVFWCPPGDTQAASRVTIEKTPDGGIQPQALVDAAGVLHLLYFKGDPAGGDLFYVRRPPGVTQFSKPVRVNSQPDSAVAIGTIRGGQFALGKNGRAHVAWNGSSKAMSKAPGKGHPMLYARLNDAGDGFELQRNLMQRTQFLDGGGTVAADEIGHVYVAWHASTPDAVKGEQGRQVWVARSTDEGKTFALETPAFARSTGACGCCGMRSFADNKGSLYLLYRAATEQVHRDMYLLASKDHGISFEGFRISPWDAGICPMSSEAFAQGPQGVLAGWETEDQVFFARVDPATFQIGKSNNPPGDGKRKHPALASSAAGQTILVWTEGTGWQRGGALAWQVFDKEGKPTNEKGRTSGAIPVWGLAAVVARPDGGFLIFH
jgi:hypothetical protein